MNHRSTPPRNRRTPQKKLAQTCGAIFLLATLILLPLSALQADSPQTSPKKPPLVVGAILPLSGELAGAGAAVRNGIELALKELPPQRQGSLEVRYEDDSFLPKNTVSAFTKLASVDKASVIIGFGSATGNAISKLSEERGITFISISSDPTVSRGKKNVFSFWVTPEAETTAVFEEAAKRSIKSIARITVVHDGAIAVEEAMDKMNKGNLTLAFDEDIPGDQKDFRPLLGRMRSKTFDVFVPLVFPEQLGIFARQAKEMGFSQPCVGYEMFEDESAVKLSNGALLGSWYATYDDGDSGFLSRYKAAYPGASTVGAANGYDTIGIVNAALLGNSALDGSKSTNKVSEHFRTLKDFQGALGTYSATGDNRFSLPAAIKIVTESGFKKKP